MILVKLIVSGILIFTVSKFSKLIENVVEFDLPLETSSRQIIQSALLVVYQATVMTLVPFLLYFVLDVSDFSFFLFFSIFLACFSGLEIWKYGAKNLLSFKRLMIILTAIILIISPILYWIEFSISNAVQTSVLVHTASNIMVALAVFSIIQFAEGYPS